MKTSLILPNTCLIRGKRETDAITSKRWLAYFGPENDVGKFCKAKKFVSIYANSENYEYYKVLKPIHLLSLPYVSLMLYDNAEINSSIQMANEFVKYANAYQDTSNTIKKYGHKRVIQDILAVLFNEDEDDAMEGDNIDIYKELKELQASVGLSSNNPDHSFAEIVCELGFDGWHRYGTSTSYNSGDELLLCNIKYMESHGFIEKNISCNLSSCQ